MHNTSEWLLFLLWSRRLCMLTEQEDLRFEKKFMHYSLSMCSTAVLFLSHCSDLWILTSESLRDPGGPLGFPVTRRWIAFRAIYAFPMPPFPPQESRARVCRDPCVLRGWPAAWAPLLGWMWVSHSLSLWSTASLLSDPHHCNLPSACHTQAYWVISLFPLILVSVTEIIITGLVCCAINYGNCGFFLSLFLDSGVNWWYPCAVFPPDHLDCCC